MLGEPWASRPRQRSASGWGCTWSKLGWGARDTATRRGYGRMLVGAQGALRGREQERESADRSRQGIISLGRRDRRGQAENTIRRGKRAAQMIVGEKIDGRRPKIVFSPSPQVAVTEPWCEGLRHVMSCSFWLRWGSEPGCNGGANICQQLAFDLPRSPGLGLTIRSKRSLIPLARMAS